MHPRKIKMNSYKQFVMDAAAYVRFAYDNNYNTSRMLGTLTHDIIGMESQDPTFTPRVTGYAQYEAGRHTEDQLEAKTVKDTCDHCTSTNARWSVRDPLKLCPSCRKEYRGRQVSP